MKKQSFLAKGNVALRSGQYVESIRFYVRALTEAPGLSRQIINNLNYAREKYRASRLTAVKPEVAVSCWELAHNPAGRAYTLAMLYEPYSNVEIIGTLFPRFGREIWEPIRGMRINIRSFIVEEESRFVGQAIELVLARPYDIVHISKPRAPNIFFGVLYKVIWGSKVLVDIDDEELAFVNADIPIKLDDYLKQEGKWPDVCDLPGKTWTRLSVGFANEFDGTTVSNTALQRKYGGCIIHHARVAIKPYIALEQKQISREKYSLKKWKKVVLFFGTPREHKGLLETAGAIASLKRKDTVFVIVGDFPDKGLKRRIQEIHGVDYCFIGNQPFSKAAEIVAISDLCVLLQDTSLPVSRFQIPAKLSDALSIGVPVLASNTPSLGDVFAAGAAIPVTENSLPTLINEILNNSKVSAQASENGLSYFMKFLEFNKNSDQLKEFSGSCACNNSSHLINEFFNAYIRGTAYRAWN